MTILFFLFRPTTNLGDSVVGHSMPNTSHPVQHFSSSQPQPVSLLANQEPQTPGVNQQPFPPLQNPPSQLSQVPLHQTQNLQSSQSFQAVSEMQKQLHPIQPSMQSFGQQQRSQVVGQQVLQMRSNQHIENFFYYCIIFFLDFRSSNMGIMSCLPACDTFNIS